MTRRWMIAVMAVSLVAAVVAIAYAAGKTPAPEVIRAQRFELVDAEGRLRAVLTDAGLVLYDEKGKSRATLSLDTDGRPTLSLSDERGKLRAMLALDGSPTLMLWDEQGEVRATLSLFSGGPGLSLCDEKGKTRALLALLNGRPSLVLADEKGQPIAGLP